MQSSTPFGRCSFTSRTTTWCVLCFYCWNVERKPNKPHRIQRCCSSFFWRNAQKQKPNRIISGRVLCVESVLKKSRQAVGCRGVFSASPRHVLPGKCLRIFNKKMQEFLLLLLLPGPVGCCSIFSSTPPSERIFLRIPGTVGRGCRSLCVFVFRVWEMDVFCFDERALCVCGLSNLL